MWHRRRRWGAICNEREFNLNPKSVNVDGEKLPPQLVERWQVWGYLHFHRRWEKKKYIFQIKIYGSIFQPSLDGANKLIFNRLDMWVVSAFFFMMSNDSFRLVVYFPIHFFLHITSVTYSITIRSTTIYIAI